MTDKNDRPVCELDGRNYVRRQSCWYDSVSHMKASAVVANRINALVKGDQQLEEACVRQDFLDDPKNRGKVMMTRRDFPDLDLAFAFDVLRVEPLDSSKSRRRARLGENVRLRFRNNDELVVECSIEPGWRETKSGWVFQESDRVDLPSGLTVRASVKVVEHTFGQWHRRYSQPSDRDISISALGDVKQTPPTFAQTECEVIPCVQMSLENSTCVFTIQWLDERGELNPGLPWCQVKERWTFQTFHSGMFDIPVLAASSGRAVSRPFYVELDLAVDPQRADKPAAEYAERTPFPSAGLPSLGKRR